MPLFSTLFFGGLGVLSWSGGVWWLGFLADGSVEAKRDKPSAER